MKFINIKIVYDYLTIIFLVSISFSKAIPNVLLACLTLLFIYNAIKNKSYSIPQVYYSSFGVLLGYLLLKQLANQSILAELNFYSRLALVIIIPILLLNVSRFKIMIGIILMSLTSIIMAFLKIKNYYFKFGVIPLNNVSQVNEVLPLERPYMGFICVISIFISIILIQKFPKFKYLFCILLVIYAGSIFLIAARLSIITLLLIIISYIFMYSKMKNLKKIVLLLVCIMTFVTIITNYTNLSKRFFVSSNFEIIIDNEPRMEIWPCSFIIMKEKSFNYFIGLENNIELKNKLTDCYRTQIKKESKRAYFLESKFNTHNQFIDVFLVGGLIGLLLFTYFCIVLIINSRNNFLIFAIAFSLIIFFFFENVLHRQYGCYLTAIILTLIIKNKNNED